MADITKLNINGTEYNIKDEIVRGLVTTLQNEGYIKASDIIDVLTSTNVHVPLSANQGRKLNVTKIDNITISGNILRFTANGNTIGSIELPTLTTNQSTQLNTAYNHSQSTHAPSNAEANVQSDWNVTDTNSDAYIANKPTKVSVFTNDAKYVNETYVDNAIENISASNIPIKDIAGNFTATNVEEALAELFQFVSNGKTLIASAITDMGVDTSNTDSFQVMANNIKMISGGTCEPTIYAITNNLTNCNTSNSASSVSKGSSYEAIITANSGYELEAITVTMGGTNITSSVVSGNTISISSVTENIVITANATAIETPTNYTITPQLTHCTCSNSATSITQGSSYSATITANSGYKLSSITVTMGGTNITSSAVSGNTVSISKVTGNVVITTTVADYSSGVTTTVTLNLTNCISINIATTALIGEGYTTTIVAKDGYTLGNIKVTLGGEDISSAVVREGGVVSIGFLRGELVITASATGGSTGVQ